MADWLTDWPTDLLFLLSDKLTDLNYLTCCVVNWGTDLITDIFIGGPIDWKYIYRLAQWLVNWLTDWLTDCRQTDILINN